MPMRSLASDFNAQKNRSDGALQKIHNTTKKNEKKRMIGSKRLEEEQLQHQKSHKPIRNIVILQNYIECIADPSYCHEYITLFPKVSREAS